MYWEGSYLWGIAGYKTGLLGVRWFIATNHEISLKKKNEKIEEILSSSWPYVIDYLKRSSINLEMFRKGWTLESQWSAWAARRGTYSMLLDQASSRLEAEKHGVYSRRQWTNDFNQCKTFGKRAAFRSYSAPWMLSWKVWAFITGSSSNYCASWHFN